MDLKNKTKRIFIKILKSSQKRKGFTLVEMSVSVFIFVLAATMLVGCLASLNKAYNNAKKIQKITENVQYVLNLMAKTIRTSDVSLSGKTLTTFDYSKSYGNGCIRYVISTTENRVQMVVGSGAAESIDGCNWSSGTTSSYLTGANTIVGSASAMNSANGRVTISLGVKTGANTIQVQTSVSARN